MSFQIAVDIGGTFTDCYLRDPDGRTRSFKTPTTPDDFTEGFLDALSKAAGAYDRSVEELLGETSQLIHGTTIATNAIIEGTTAETALLTTAGFRDTLLLRQGGKEDPYDWDMDYPEPYVPRHLTFGIDERVSAEGQVLEPLDEDAVRETLRSVAERDVDAVAVALLWSHVNPDHERRVGELIEAELDVDYSLSHEVNPIIREYRRTVSTAIDASLKGEVRRYFSRLRERLVDRGYGEDPLIVTANGGVMPIDEIVSTPVWTVDSGPTMLPVAVSHLAARELDVDDVIALDMGGTSLDIGVVRDGRIPRTREATVGDDILGIEKVEVRSIGSGGGSIAWVDDGGLLRVGPESAGAEPGPACFGRGGDRPTVTDAALVLGYLDPDYFLGGEMRLDAAAGREAIAEHVGAPLDLDPIEAAHSVYATANQSMVNGIKELTLSRGIDPGQFSLAGGGGALGTHVVELARELRIDDVLLPGEAGVVSSIGALASDMRRDFSASQYTESHRFDRHGVNAVLADLVGEAEEFFERAGISEPRRELTAYAEARYPGQVWELQIELPGTTISDGEVEGLVDRFHEIHDATYGFRMDDHEVEFLYWRVEATGLVDTDLEGDAPEAGPGTDPVPHGHREAYFDGGLTATPAFRPEGLVRGSTIEGPAVVDVENTTIVVPPAAGLRVTGGGHFHLKP